MRRITKNMSLDHPGVKLLAGKKTPTTAAEAATAWKNFENGKKLLRNLLGEQFHLCCYSEIRADLLGLGYHNEHVKPKSKFPHQTFDYANLAASALASDPDLKTFGIGKQHDSFGGDFKDDEYDPQFISPHRSDAIVYFVFDENGQVSPAEMLSRDKKECAAYTIKALNLQCAYLASERKKWWAELEQATDQAIQAGNAEVGKLIASYFSLRDGKLDPFFSVTRQFFGAAAETYLAKYAPHLL